MSLIFSIKIKIYNRILTKILFKFEVGKRAIILTIQLDNFNIFTNLSIIPLIELNLIFHVVHIELSFGNPKIFKINQNLSRNHYQNYSS